MYYNSVRGMQGLCYPRILQTKLIFQILCPQVIPPNLQFYWERQGLDELIVFFDLLAIFRCTHKVKTLIDHPLTQYTPKLNSHSRPLNSCRDHLYFLTFALEIRTDCLDDNVYCVGVLARS